VAVLVPTTLLAHQHYDNFAERFAPFPTRVALLSRFQSPKDTKAIVKDTEAGLVDVLIGTHRLLQKDVKFRNLGLVIIDEEQWFGVKHKERLKQLRTQVDVLTLTATPIPRTLQMTMASVRDLSIIDTPPSGRLAIRTQVLRFSEKAIREAILRELGRGGQTYFVHNRVETMERMGAWLQELVPEARIVMAHGQMDSKPLEAVMLKFFHREADILIASAIIQSGIDVPTANTIIVNRADTFGLAQLYQLRGRVGRGGEQAYAYFLVPDEGNLSEDAQKRLTAIQQFTELGSGFRIAAADLEIRGAGNLLGKQQSGHIAAVGLDLYLQMVEQAVQRLKGQVVEEEPDPDAASQRLRLYSRRLRGRQPPAPVALQTTVFLRTTRRPGADARRDRGPLRASARSGRASVRAHANPAAGQATPAELCGRATACGRDHLRSQGHGLRNRRASPDGPIQKRLRFLSPLSFELQIPHEDWSLVFPELNATLQTLHVCGTNNQGPRTAST
jgi:transcription-repair coupling factor (superfamily II helicase)